MVKKKTWEEFRETGLFWWINSILHTFGWALVYEVGDDDTMLNIYPARVKFRGFSYDCVSNGYRKISEYMVKEAPELLKEAKE